MKLRYIIASLALGAAFAGCSEADEFIPSIYVTEAQIEPAKTITISREGETAEFSVSAALAVDRDTHVQLEVVPELLESYNKAYGRECVLLEKYDFEKKEVTIKSGKSVSDAAEIVVNQTLELGKFYCLPVKIVGTDGTMPVLEPSSTFYLVFRAPVHSKAVYLGSSNKYLVPGFYDYKVPADAPEGTPDLSALPELTLECRVMAKSFKASDPYISSIMGLEGNVCMRFGDVKIGKDVVQVCKGDYQPAATKMPCATDKWYHLAAVWSKTSLKIYIDGRFITETPNRGEKVDITEVQIWQGNPSIGFGIGAGSNYNSHRPLDGYIAEARVWARALTGTEIANLRDLVIVDPQSKGLVAYWKMNESEPISEYESNSRWTFKNKIVDLTGHGFDAKGQSANPTFIDATW